jgi:hypothetical protein
VLEYVRIGAAQQKNAERGRKQEDIGEAMREPSQRRGYPQDMFGAMPHSSSYADVPLPAAATPAQYMLMRTFLSVFISSKQRPVPSATQDSGSSAMDTGRPVE